MDALPDPAETHRPDPLQSEQVDAPEQLEQSGAPEGAGERAEELAGLVAELEELETDLDGIAAQIAAVDAARDG